MPSTKKNLKLEGVIADAVMPVKMDAVTRAEVEARNMVGYVEKKLAECNDLDVIAPRAHGRMSRAEYKRAYAKRAFYERITTRVGPGYHRMNDPHIAAISPEGVERYIEIARRDAALQYDAFVSKMVTKIGDVASATLAGSHVWGHSVLTVTRHDGTVERWKTQMIVNQSALGTLFNQWPSRKIK